MRNSGPRPRRFPALEEIPRILGLKNGRAEPSGEGPAAEPPSTAVTAALKPLDLRIRVAGFGGQGVLMLGEILAETGLGAGYEVSWLPSYGPEMRSGTSNCHVRVSSQPVDSPLVSRPNILLAMNEPSLRKFLPYREPGGTVLYNGEELPEDLTRGDVRIIVRPFTRLADEMGASKAANIVMLGALLEATGLLPDARLWRPCAVR